MSVLVAFFAHHHSFLHPALSTALLRHLHSPSKAPSSPSLHLKLHLLRQENFPPSHLKLLQDNPHFASVSYERVASFVSFLRAKGLSGPSASRMLVRNPRILCRRVESLETKCTFFQDLGVETPGLQRILSSCYAGTVLGASMKTLQKRIDFLREIGLNKQDFRRLLTRWPMLLCMNSEVNMRATLNYFEQQGLSGDGFVRLVREQPQVFGHSIDRFLTEKMEFLRGLGLNLRTRRGARALSGWLSLSSRTLLSRWNALKDLGFSNAGVKKMVICQPEILGLKHAHVSRKIHYLKTVLNRDLQEAVNFPPYLCLSFENRIVPRFTFLMELKERGKLALTRSLSSLLAPSDESFEMRYAAGYVIWKAGYLEKRTGSG